MAVIFWDAEGLVHLEWFNSTTKRRGLTGDLYVEMLGRMYESLNDRSPEKVKRGILILQDNAHCRKTSAVSAKMRDLELKTLDHPPYSPDLAPSDFYLFRGLKQFLEGRKNDDQEELDGLVRTYFRSKPASFFKEGIDLLRTKMERTIESEGRYLEE